MALPKTILVVEHDDAIRDLLIEILNDEGYHTYSAPTGRSALAMLSHNWPALTLFDTALPDLSAGELIDELQALGLVGVRLVLMTTVQREMSSSLMDGTLACLVKPFEIDTLLTVVARCVEPQFHTRASGLETNSSDVSSYSFPSYDSID